jgi:hypothetical protein
MTEPRKAKLVAETMEKALKVTKESSLPKQEALSLFMEV